MVSGTLEKGIWCGWQNMILMGIYEDEGLCFLHKDLFFESQANKCDQL